MAQSSKHVASSEVWQDRVWHALRHLDDRSVLNQSALARLAYIQRLAEKEYRGNILVRGLALNLKRLVKLLTGVSFRAEVKALMTG